MRRKLTVSSFSVSLLLVLCTMLPEVMRLPNPAITDICFLVTEHL